MSNQPKVAAVTGAASGIGRAIALRLAKDGYALAVADLPRAREALDAVVKEIGENARPFEADVTKEEDVERFVSGAVEAFGGLDIFVANAGITTVGSIVDQTIDDWERVLGVNTLGTMLCYKHAAKQMIAQGRGGRIIGAASIAGKRGFPLSAAYCTSKFAVRGLTQAAASDLGKFGITVNCYSPGYVDTPLLASVKQTFSEKFQVPPEAWKQQIESGTVLGRVGKPDEIAGLVAYLATPQAEYITGQCISIDGGFNFD